MHTAPTRRAPEVCFHEAAALLACDASERPDDTAADLERLRDHLEEAARRPPMTNEYPGAVPPPAELDPSVTELDPVARGLACHAEPGAAAWALYWMARVRYEAHRYAQAATLFDEVVQRSPQSEIAGFAASLGLDALATRARQQPALEATCHARMADRVPVYERTLCADDRAEFHEDTCAILGRLGCHIGRREAEALEEAGEMAAASLIYEGLEGDGCERGDELLFNAAVTAEHAGDTDRARTLREALARRFPQSALVAR